LIKRKSDDDDDDDDDDNYDSGVNLFWNMGSWISYSWPNILLLFKIQHFSQNSSLSNILTVHYNTYDSISRPPATTPAKTLGSRDPQPPGLMSMDNDVPDYC